MHKLFRRSSTRDGKVFAAVIPLLIACVVAAAPFSPAAAGNETGELATLTGDHQKQQFVAGERVEVTRANVADDVFAAGRDLIFDAVSAKYIIAAGMSLSLKAINADDLILAGGQIDLSGTVADDVVAAVCPVCPFGGRLEIADTTQIGDDARLAGRDIIVDGRIGGNLYAVAKQFRLSGEIAGDARIEAERIVLAPGARIGGDLLYASQAKPEIPDSATVVGQLRQVEPMIPISDGSQINWILYAVLAVLGFLLALFLLGAVLQLAVPGLMSGSAAAAVERPWASLGRGVILAVLTPALVALLMATVIGAPVALVTMATYFVLLALSFVAISYCVGLYVRGLVRAKEVAPGTGSRVLWTLAGILILVIVGLIPFVGWAVIMLAMIAGLGAVMSLLWPMLRGSGMAQTPA